MPPSNPITEAGVEERAADEAGRWPPTRDMIRFLRAGSGVPSGICVGRMMNAGTAFSQKGPGPSR